MDGDEAVTNDGRAEQPYKIEGRECRTLAELANALEANWANGIEHLTGGYVGKWIEDSLRDIDSKIALDRLLKDDLPADQLLFAFIARHWAGGPPPFKGVPVCWEELERIARDELPEGLNKREFLFELYRHSILPLAAEATGDDRLAELDRVWRKEFLDYCTARSEYLSYQEIWDDRGGALDMILAAPEGEAFFINNFKNGARNELAARLVDAKAKEQIFDAQFDAEYAQRLRLNREEKLLRELRERAWFAKLDRPEDSSLGRDLAVSTASLIAAAEHGALHRQIEAVEQQQADAGEDWPFGKLGQKGHAIFYGLAMAFAAFRGIASFGWETGGWETGGSDEAGTPIALVVMAVYFVTLYGAVAEKRRKRIMIAIGFGLLALGTLPLATLATGSTFMDVIVFGGLFALLGWLRKPFIARMRKKQLKAEQAQLTAGLAGSDRFEEDPEVVLGYLDFFSRGIPRHKILEHARQARPLHQGAPEAAVGNDGRPRKSAPAAYQTEGLSYGIAGMNVGADGAITHELMDGVSFDTKGRVNTRIVDGVTMHSDGKVTTNVTKGLDVRSDGQVSVEMFGLRHSWGGKKSEKKKDSWF